MLHKLEVFIREYDGYWAWKCVGYFPDAKSAKIYGFRNCPSIDFKIIEFCTEKLIYEIINYKDYVKIRGITDDGLHYSERQVINIDGFLKIKFCSRQQSSIANICYLTRDHIMSYNKINFNFDWKKVGF